MLHEQVYVPQLVPSESCLRMKRWRRNMQGQYNKEQYKKLLISCSNLMHPLFIIFISFLYMFRAILCSSSGGFIVYIQHLVLCMSLFLGDRSVHRQLEDCLCTERSSKKSDIQRTRCCMYTMNPPDDKHNIARNMQRNVINIIKKWCIKLEHEIKYLIFVWNFRILVICAKILKVYDKECAVTKEFCVMRSSCASVCNQINQIYILTVNAKSPVCRSQTKVTQITKILKFQTKTKCQPISLLPYITMVQPY